MNQMCRNCVNNSICRNAETLDYILDFMSDKIRSDNLEITFKCKLARGDNDGNHGDSITIGYDIRSGYHKPIL